MSSWPIPSTAPFAPEDIEVLNRVVGPASPIQRAWLAGFLAGLDAAAAAAAGAAYAPAGLAPAPTAVPQPAAPAQPAEPLTIENGTLRIREGAGLGIDIDAEKLARYRQDR